MGYTTNTSSTVSNNNSDNSIDCPGFNIFYGNIVSCTKTTITLNSLASSNSDEYNNLVIEILDGTGSGILRKVIDYDGTTKTVTVSFMNELPSLNSRCVIHKYSGILSSQDQPGRKRTIKLPSHMSNIDNFYEKQMIRIIHSDMSNESKFIESYEGNSRVMTVKSDWNEYIMPGEYFILSGESGPIVSATSNTITLDGNQSSSVVPGLIVEIISGIGNEEFKKIVSISGNVVTLDTDWTIVPNNTSRYRIFSGWMGTFESSDNFVQISYFISLQNYQRYVSVSAVSNESSKANALYSIKYSYSSDKITNIFNAKGRYFRIYIVTMGTSATGYISTSKEFASGQEINPIDKNINNTIDSNMVRAIITGKNSENNKFKNISTDSSGNLNVNIMQPVDIFNHIVIAEPRPLVELKFPYSTSHYTQDYFTRGSGILYNSGNSVLIASTAIPNTTVTTESIGRLKSVQRSHYAAGLALRITFSALFSAPLAGCRQLIGHGDQNNGIFFGYNGTNFGILRRYGGKSEIRMLTITSGATSTGNIVVELNGISTNIPVINGDSKYTVAKNIYNGIKVAPYYLQTEYAYMNPGWLTVLEQSDKVLFMAEDSGPHANSFSVSGQGVTGSFSRVQAGILSTDDWTYTYDWVYDRMDRNNSLPEIDFSKGNIFEIDIQWLGFGNISFNIENPITGKMSLVHKIKYPNTYMRPSIDVPNQPLMLEAYNGSTTGLVSVSSACMTSHIIGKDNIYNSTRFGTSEIKQKSLSSGKRYNILSLRNNATMMNTTNVISQLGLSIASSWKAVSAAIFHVVVNANLEIPYTISVNSAGTGYVAGEIKEVTGGSGTGMKIKVISVGNSGELTNVSLDVPGSGYVEQDIVTLLGGNGGIIDVNHVPLTWIPRKYGVSVGDICKDFVEITGGEEQFSIAMGSNTSFFETFNDMEIYMPPMYTMSLSIQPIADEINAEFSSSFFWSEKS